MAEPDSSQPRSGSKPPSLRKNFAWTFLGNLVNAGSQWALVVILAKRTSPETVGQFAYALALTTPIMLFTSLKLRSAQATDQRYEYRFGEYWSLRVGMTALALVVISLAGIFNGSGKGAAWVIVMVGLAKGVESLSDIVYGLFQQHERMDLISRSMILRGVLALAMAGAILSITASLVAVVGCLLLSWLIVLILYDIANAKRLLPSSADSFRLVPEWTNPRLKQLLWLTLPLGASLAIGSLYNNIPRYVIEHRLGADALGIFSALAYFMLFGGMIFTALGQSLIPRLARHHAEANDSRFRQTIVKLMCSGLFLGTLGVVVSLLFGDEIINLVYTSQYAENSRLLVLLMLANLVDFAFITIGCAINAMRFFTVQVYISSISAVVVTVSSLILVDSHGLNGIAVAMILAKLSEAVLYLLVLLKYFHKTHGEGCNVIKDNQ